MKHLKQSLAFIACFTAFAAIHAVQIRREPGCRIPEYVLPTDRDDPELWMPSSPYSRTMMAASPGNYATNDIPKTGTHEYLLVLVEFKDLHFIIDDADRLREQFNRMFNGKGYSDNTTYTYKKTTFKGATGSVSEYFTAQSFGSYTPTFRIIGPIQMSQGYAVYGKNYSTDDDSYGVELLIKEVCDSLLSFNINLSDYTRKGDIDHLSIIYAGRGENYNGSDPNTIWPQAGKIYYNKSGIKDIKYACTCELFWDSDTIIDGIGTFCHEFSHTLGLPDVYNTKASDSKTYAPMGYWSIMDFGSYENEGFSPVGYTAFEKYSLGWMDIEEISEQGVYYLHDISKKPDIDADIHSAYRLNTGDDDKFIILENHIKTGWYKYHASEGLMITAIDYDYNSWKNNTINASSHKRYQILPADNNYERTTNAGDLFPYMDKDSITTKGTPILSSGSSFPLYSIYNIRKNNNIISFLAAFDMKSSVDKYSAQEIAISIDEEDLLVNAASGSHVIVYDLAGQTVADTYIAGGSDLRISLPGKGIWIVKCGNKTRKVRN